MQRQIADPGSLRVHPPAVHYRAPLVFTIDGLLSAAECRAEIDLAKGRMRRAKVSGAKSGVVSAGRTNSVLWLAHRSTPALLAIAERVALAAQHPLDHAEPFQIIHYGIGAEYRGHFDAFDPNTARGQRNLQGGGQRLVTALVYLNAPDGGGGTAFPRLGLEIAAKPGRLLIFHNCLANSTLRSPYSIHAGMPVTAGEKWAFNLWFREAPPGAGSAAPQDEAEDDQA